MVGELSKFQRITITPSNSTHIQVSHGLGVVPTIVMISGDPDFSGGLSLLSNGILGQVVGGIASGANNATNGYKVSIDTTGTTNSNAYLSDTTVLIRQASSSRYFDTNCTYTIDLYA